MGFDRKYWIYIFLIRFMRIIQIYEIYTGK